MIWIKIEPLDVLLFRESRPFSAGDQVRAGGAFPPSGLPFVGAIRSAILSHRHIGFAEYRIGKGQERIGTPEDLGPLAFSGPFLVRDKELLLPLPRDLVEPANGGPSYLVPRERAGANQTLSSPPGPETEEPPVRLPFALVNTSEGAKEPEGGYLRGDGLLRYLAKEVSSEHKEDNVVAVDEPRVGIGRSGNRTVEKGLIYSVQFKRLVRGASFLMGLDSNGSIDDLLPPRGTMALGGEGRIASFAILEQDDLPKPIQQDMTEELVAALTGKCGFKLYLLSPAIFTGGWIPDGSVKTTVGAEKKYLWTFIPGVSATLATAAVGKRQEIGGWNLAKGAPRPLRRAVPAGSVYFFRTDEPLDDKKARQVVANCHFRSIMQPAAADRQSRFCRQAGFGIAAVGVWE